jgi:hypothetical protein
VSFILNYKTMQLKTSPLVVALAFFGTNAIAFPGFDDHAWIAPKAGDVRSPCPGLNT